jgi:hypothetical protein
MTHRIYTNPLAQPADLDGWRMEGEGRAARAFFHQQPDHPRLER